MNLIPTSVFMAVLACAPSAAASYASYHIGNSLTWDARPSVAPAISASVGIDHDTGWHIRCGQPLNYIQANPADTCVNPQATYGLYQDAVAGFAWDAVTIQPYQSTSVTTSTLGSDVAMILDTINRTQTNAANADTVFYLYETWPQFPNSLLNNFDAAFWLDAWNQAYAPTSSDVTRLNADYFDALLPAVRSQTAADVRVIPVGDVLALLANTYGDGLLPGTSFGNTFYRDENHMSRDLGRVVAAMTFFAVLHGTHPDRIAFDFPTGNGFNDGGGVPSRLTPTLQAALADAVWSVVSTHPDTGVVVGDYNGDGVVEQGDLDLVLLNWGQDGAVPPVGWVKGLPGGVIDQEELDAVLLNWGGTSEPDLTHLPEPAAGVFCCLSSLLVRRPRRRSV